MILRCLGTVNGEVIESSNFPKHNHIGRLNKRSSRHINPGEVLFWNDDSLNYFVPRKFQFSVFVVEEYKRPEDLGPVLRHKRVVDTHCKMVVHDPTSTDK